VGEEKMKTLWIHGGLVLAETICASGFTVEYLRARSGNTLSWAYVFEWPIFAGYAVYMWRKLLKDEVGEPARSDHLPPDAKDPALETYNEYLRSVHGGAPDAPRNPPHGAE
jgi:hypothetical protein